MKPMLMIAAVALLVTAVFTGVVRAVEAAATAGCLAVAWALVSRELKGHDWRELLSDSLSLSGALFALLVGPTGSLPDPSPFAVPRRSSVNCSCQSACAWASAYASRDRRAPADRGWAAGPDVLATPFLVDFVIVVRPFSVSPCTRRACRGGAGARKAGAAHGIASCRGQGMGGANRKGHCFALVLVRSTRQAAACV